MVGDPCIFAWEMEMNAHSIHPWKGDHMCYYSKFDPSVVACSLEFCNVDKCLNSGLKVNVTSDWWGFMFTNVHNGITIHIKHNVVFYARSLFCMPNSLACEDFIYLIIGKQHWEVGY
jgi:hypothetical protein